MSDFEYKVVPAWSRYVVSIIRKSADKKPLEALLYTSQQRIFIFSDLFDVMDVVLVHCGSARNCSKEDFVSMRPYTGATRESTSELAHFLDNVLLGTEILKLVALPD